VSGFDFAQARALLADAARGAARRVRGRTLVVAASAAACLLVPLLLGLIIQNRKPGDVAVRRGTLQPSVPLVGILAADHSEAYGAAVPGVEVKILWLVEEGTLVRPEDRLILFDAAPFQRELETSRSRARELSEEAAQATLALEATKLKAAVDLQEARTVATASERDLEALVNSAAPLLVKESRHDIEQKERALQEAETKLAGLEPFVSKGFVSQEEFRAAQTRREQAAADLELARAKHDALVHQTNPDLIRRKLEESESGRLQLKAGGDRSKILRGQAEAAARLASVRLEEANRLVQDAEKKIAACTVVARAPGLAVHSEFFDKAGERRKVRVGDAVWGGTTVVTLPDLANLHIEGRVPESEIHVLAPGQKARVRLDAFPDMPLEGVLRRIGSLGASEKNETRSFPVTVALSQTDARFRPGMIARATIDGESVANALLLPIEAVRSDEQGSYAVVVSALGSTSVRRIKTGRSTSRLIEIQGGLDAGDIVRIAGE
jgi:HlyD family secretion protein